MTKISVKLDLKAKKTVEKTANFEGNVPTGTIEITENGEYDVASYANANVNVEDVPAVVEPVTVNPTTSEQVIEPKEGVDGFNKVTVEAVTSSIDNKIIPSNIKKGVSILGVEGNIETKQNLTKEIYTRFNRRSIDYDRLITFLKKYSFVKEEDSQIVIDDYNEFNYIPMLMEATINDKDGIYPINLFSLRTYGTSGGDPDLMIFNIKFTQEDLNNKETIENSLTNLDLFNLFSYYEFDEETEYISPQFSSELNPGYDLVNYYKPEGEYFNTTPVNLSDLFSI